MVDAYVAKLAKSQLAKGRNNFAPDFVGHVELDHAHGRRAERGVFLRSHGGAMWLDKTVLKVWLMMKLVQGNSLSKLRRG